MTDYNPIEDFGLKEYRSIIVMYWEIFGQYFKDKDEFNNNFYCHVENAETISNTIKVHTQENFKAILLKGKGAILWLDEHMGQG